MDLYGLNIEDIRTAIGSMKDVFVKEEAGATKGWVFKHPTIREAVAFIVKDDPDLIEIAIRGSSLVSLLTEGVCEGVTLQGARLVIPASLEAELVARIRNEEPWSGWIIDFLTDRASQSFRHRYFDGQAGLAHPVVAASLRATDRACRFMGTLDSEGILEPSAKAAFIKMLIERAGSLACSDFPLDARLIMSPDEFQSALKLALTVWEERRDQILSHYAGEWSSDVRPESYYEGLLDKLSDLAEASGGELSDDLREQIWEEASYYISDLEVRYVDPEEDEDPEELVAPSSSGPDVEEEAEIDALFSDVAA